MRGYDEHIKQCGKGTPLVPREYLLIERYFESQQSASIRCNDQFYFYSLEDAEAPAEETESDEEDVINLC